MRLSWRDCARCALRLRRAELLRDGCPDEWLAEPGWATGSSPYSMVRRRFDTMETKATIRMTAARLKIRT